VIVTTSQDVAVMDAFKAAKFIEKLELPVIGVIENMSGMICPHCGETIDLFSSGGEKKLPRIWASPILVPSFLTPKW
jgi:ATP-binding protein involved in chromosome partitioning